MRARAEPRGAAALGDFTATWRVVPMALAGVGIGVLAAYVALALLRLIGLFTNLFFFQRWDSALVSPAGSTLGPLVVLVPVGGALVLGAAAGMSATFASPVAAVLLAVELLLFEWKPRSMIPVALASATAAAARRYLIGLGPLFPTPPHPVFIGPGGLLGCALVGLAAGVLSALLTLAVYAAEGTGFWPLVSMGAILGGTMRSPFTGVVFAVELTHDVNMLLPLLIAVTLAHATTVLALRRSILTEKVARRGYHLTREYSVDPLEILFVREVMRPNVAVLPADLPLAGLTRWLEADGRTRRARRYP